jgi:ribosomal protein S18 acetylase RimI-like enzyme
MPQLVSLHDKASIRAYTMHNPLLHIYEIGDLDDFFWPHTVWYGWVDEGVITQLALLYMPFSPPVLLSHANPQRTDHGEFLDALMLVLPRTFYSHVDTHAVTAFAPHYTAEHHGHYHKMGLQDVATAIAADDGRASLLTPADIPALERLYAAAYPGNWFDARMLQTGFYAGIRDGDSIIATAGIHVVSQREGVAALGNVTTLPHLRGHGYGRSVCAHLVRQLHAAGIGHIGLNVSAHNTAAIALYQRLGFTTVAEYHEYLFTMHGG